MTIHLPEDLGNSLRGMVRSGRFASLDDATAEAVRQFLREAGPERDEAEHARRQLDNLKKLCDQLEVMPVAAPTEGFSNRDHDQVLYGR